MKSIALYLFSLCFACTTLAQELASNQRNILLFSHESVPMYYTDGEVLARNEVFRILVCSLKTGATLATGEIPFSFDQAGQLLPEEKLSYCNWGAFAKQTSSGTYDYLSHLPVDVNAETGESYGLPTSTATSFLGEGERRQTVSTQILTTESASLTMKTLYIYLIVMDSRVPVMKDGVWQETLAVPEEQAMPTRVTEWSATLLTTAEYGFGSDKNVSINYTKNNTFTQVNFAAMTKASAVTSLTIDNVLVDATDGENDEEDQATIDAYLSPSVAGLVADADGNHTLTASSSDQILYKLQTRESLSEGDWQDVDTWLASFETNTEAASEENAESAKKELANDSLPCYNRLRIGQGSSIPLPRVLGEPTRFYRLKSE